MRFLVKPAFTSLIFSFFLVAAISIFFPPSSSAAGGGGDIRLTPSPTSTLADGVSRINVTVESVIYICNDGDWRSDPDECETPEKMGYSGNEGRRAVDEAYLSGDPELTLSTNYVETLGTAPGSFYVTSATIGTFNIHVVRSSGEVLKKHPVTFTDPAPEPTPVQNPTPAQTSTPTNSSTEEIKKPDVPTTKLVDSDGDELKPAEGEEKISFEEKQPIVLSGTTVPNGEVKLYIFSEPQEATVVADAEGGWTYTIENLEPGDHRVEVEVTDPATGETSERAEVLAFQIAQAEETIQTTVAEEPAEDDDTSLSLVMLLVVVLLALGTGGFWWWKKNKKGSHISHELSIPTGENEKDLPTSEDKSQ